MDAQLPPPSGNFGEALVALMPRLRRFCLSLTGSSHAGDDLMQAVFERALGKQDQFQAGTRLDHWLLQLARNINIDQIRAAKVRGGPAESLDLVAEAAGEDGPRIVEARSDLSHAAQAFLAMPDSQREAFALVVLEGLSYREAADTLAIPVGTVMSRIARARAAIAHHVHRQAGQTEVNDGR